MSGNTDTQAHIDHPPPQEPATLTERRAVLRRFGTFAAVTAPAMAVLLASRQGEAMGMMRGGNGHSGGNGKAGGSCGFSC